MLLVSENVTLIVRCSEHECCAGGHGAAPPRTAWVQRPQAGTARGEEREKLLMLPEDADIPPSLHA